MRIDTTQTPSPVRRCGRGLVAKRRLLAGGAALIASGAVGGAALAATPYSVKLKVPSIVQGARFKTKATGTSQKTSRLTVFIAGKCAASPTAEASVPKARMIINKKVVHSFTATKTANAGAAGSHKVCAYLTPPRGSHVRAHAKKSYTAVTGGY